MPDSEWAEYRCSACHSSIKKIAIQCKVCEDRKLFYHPGCLFKHRVYNTHRELVKCEGPFEEIKIESDREEMKKTTAGGSGRERKGSIGATGLAANMSGSSSTDIKIDWLVKTIKEIKDEVACKNEIKSMITEIVRSELQNIKKELEELKQNMQGRIGEARGNARSYSDAVMERKRESVIIVKPKKQQQSEDTKKVVKEKIDVKNMAVGITKLRKGNNGSVILGCDNEGEIEKLKATMKDKLGEGYNIMELKGVKPKIKVINVGEEEMKLEEENLIDVIKKQNKIDDNREGFHMRIIKKLVKERKGDTQSRRGGENGSLILEIDEATQESILKREKINIGWRKCMVFNYFSVKRCFKCWGFYHIAKNCTREDTCHKCAGNHEASKCKETKKRCVNCMHKIRTYNVKISDEHDALSRECSTFLRALEEEKKKTGRGNIE